MLCACRGLLCEFWWLFSVNWNILGNYVVYCLRTLLMEWIEQDWVTSFDENIVTRKKSTLINKLIILLCVPLTNSPLILPGWKFTSFMLFWIECYVVEAEFSNLLLMGLVLWFTFFVWSTKEAHWFLHSFRDFSFNLDDHSLLFQFIVSMIKFTVVSELKLTSL